MEFKLQLVLAATPPDKLTLELQHACHPSRLSPSSQQEPVYYLAQGDENCRCQIYFGMGEWRNEICFTLALTLNPLPQERKSPLADSGFADDCPANPVAGFSKRRRTILLLLGEKAGLRESVTSNYSRAGNCLPLDCPDGTNKSGVWPSPATAMHERRRTLAKSMPACFAALLRPGTGALRRSGEYRRCQNQFG